LGWAQASDLRVGEEAETAWHASAQVSDLEDAPREGIILPHIAGARRQDYSLQMFIRVPFSDLNGPVE
jgi:hypothetical protein